MPAAPLCFAHVAAAPAGRDAVFPAAAVEAAVDYHQRRPTRRQGLDCCRMLVHSPALRSGSAEVSAVAAQLDRLEDIANSLVVLVDFQGWRTGRAYLAVADGWHVDHVGESEATAGFGTWHLEAFEELDRQVR